MAVEYDQGVIIGADSRTTTGCVGYFHASFSVTTIIAVGLV